MRARRGCAIASRSPGPADQRIPAHMMHDVFERAAAVARRIFDLLADLRECLALPGHLMRRQMPGRIARYSRRFEIGRLVTVWQRIAGSPKPSSPRATGGWCKRWTSPWRGRSPAGWQFTQRGWASTLPASVNRAAERAAVSATAAKLSGVASVSAGAPEAACVDISIACRAVSASRIVICRLDFMMEPAKANSGSGRPKSRHAPPRDI